MFSDCCAIRQTPASRFGLQSADQALRAPHPRPLSSLEKSYSIAREIPAIPWSCRMRRTRNLLLFSSNLERFARLYSLRRHTRVNKRHAPFVPRELGAQLRPGRKDQPMELHQVRYFLAVSSTLNFTRAAEQCNVTHPALTN